MGYHPASNDSDLYRHYSEKSTFLCWKVIRTYHHLWSTLASSQSFQVKHANRWPLEVRRIFGHAKDPSPPPCGSGNANYRPRKPISTSIGNAGQQSGGLLRKPWGVRLRQACGWLQRKSQQISENPLQCWHLEVLAGRLPNHGLAATPGNECDGLSFKGSVKNTATLMMLPHFHTGQPLPISGSPCSPRARYGVSGAMRLSVCETPAPLIAHASSHKMPDPARKSHCLAAKSTSGHHRAQYTGRRQCNHQGEGAGLTRSSAGAAQAGCSLA